MGDFLKVMAVLGLGGVGFGAFNEVKPNALLGTPFEGAANDMQHAVRYLKNDVLHDFNDLIETVNNARK